MQIKCPQCGSANATTYEDDREEDTTPEGCYVTVYVYKVTECPDCHYKSEIQNGSYEHPDKINI